ncbi:TPA: hypothetical protein ACJI8J_000401 [Kluyvera georgiana]|uniref:hypothetical protein n=1 Tax=Kluyvera georgiana TaxID=73098 RepID=UPI0023041211|nr:hypothetical protein [Kluyvera georgiana]MDA8494849.1 hypothetical protein [Kluyvera georgiana]
MSTEIHNATLPSEAGALRAIALGSGTAAGGLLLKMATMVGVGSSMILLAALAVSIGLGVMLARQRGIARHGFLLAAAGWLLVLLTILNGHIGNVLLPGILIGGVGLGLAHGRYVVEKRTGTTISCVVALTTVLLIQACAAPGLMGYVFAFALPIDLALLGALLVRIAEQESR